MHGPLARAGPLVATQNLHKRVTLTNSYNNMVRNLLFVIFVFANRVIFDKTFSYS